MLKSELMFVSEHGAIIINLIEFFEIRDRPTAHLVFNKLLSFKNEIVEGRTNVFFKTGTESMICNPGLSNIRLATWLENFQDSYRKACGKFETHFEKQEKSLALFKAIRIFDPLQRQQLSRDIKNYSVIFDCNNNAVLDEWAQYWALPPIENEEFDLQAFWKEQLKIPILKELALNFIWLPSAAAEVERSFSKLKCLEAPNRLQMSDKTMIDSIFCYVNNNYIEL